jgi:DHA1 family inner membrane transport protein
MYIVIATLSMIVFILGTEKFGMVGLLPEMIKQLGITTQQAYSLVSIYSLGVMFAGPVTILLLKHIKRKLGLVILVSLIAVGNIIITFSSTYSLVLIGRFISSFGHASFSGLSSVIAFEICPKDKRCLAISIITGGFTIANIIGVPICTYIAEKHNFNGAFGFISLLSVAGVALVWRYIPNNDANFKESKNITTKEEIKHIISNKSVSSSLLITFVNYTAFFLSITYMGVFVKTYLPRYADHLPVILSIYGIGMTTASMVIGKIYDFQHKKTAAIYITLLVLIADLVLPFSTKIQSLSVFCFVIIGGCGFGLVPFYKAKIIEKSVVNPNFASTLNICAINFGVVAGSFLASNFIKFYDLMYVSIFSSAILLISLVLIIYNLSFDKNNKIHPDLNDDKLSVTDDLEISRR